MDELQVISRDTIPPIREVEHEGEVHALGELRDFRWNDQLREFMPPTSEFSVSWVQLAHGEVLSPHVHPIQSMMIFYSGSGQMLGDLRGPIGEGDVVVVPAGRAHGFEGGPAGLYALSIQFGEGLYTEPEKPRVHFMGGGETLDELLAHNQARMGQFAERPIFDLFASGALADGDKRAAFLEAERHWVEGPERLVDAALAEQGLPASARGGAAPAADIVMSAFTSWFEYQMRVLDRVERIALTHLVLARASAAYHLRALTALASHAPSAESREDRPIREAREMRVESARQLAVSAEARLRGESPRTYARIKTIVGEAWDMVGAMTDRIAELASAR